MATFPRLPSPKPIDDFEGWMAAFTQPTVVVEMVVLAVCVALSWALVGFLRKALNLKGERSIWFGTRVVDGVLFPLALLCLAYAARAVLENDVPVAIFKVAIPVLFSLVAIRVGVKVLQAAFTEAPWVRALEHTISWIAWAAMVLWVSGLLPVILNELDQITWKIGASTLSVRNLIEGLLTAGVVLIITLWISSAIETRLLRSATGGELSLRKAVSNASRALLMFVGLILALSTVGIDLTALSVLGGAVGVGIGFGLQKLAANYVSGFVILAERSMRIGDFVRVDGFEGFITHINARCTLVRAQDGRESIVPNEMLITSRVENLSLADSLLNQRTSVSVAYDSDPEQVIQLLLNAVLDQKRVLRDPMPTVNLTAFGADGLEFSVIYWIDDIENGQGNLRSLVNLAILKALRDNNIEIPYPQRVVHTRS
ncbi:MAG: mechanosensitive ion channel protein [Burkholderiales bacterium RIFCSPLOWO2_12_FULL_61_40]|nr:MAG: mechanosensitive ion channel protein [Burkholderiales bacterium RIFCSPLOWO2_12_FULL_61_40]